jgi:hypothetical protein
MAYVMDTLHRRVEQASEICTDRFRASIGYGPLFLVLGHAGGAAPFGSPRSFLKMKCSLARGVEMTSGIPRAHHGGWRARLELRIQ